MDSWGGVSGDDGPSLLSSFLYAQFCVEHNLHLF